MGLDSIGSSPMLPNYLLKLNYVYFINHLKLNIAKQNFFFDIIVTPSVKQMLHIFYTLGIVRRFHRLQSTRYRVYPGWSSSSLLYRRVKVYSHTKNPLKISVKALSVLKQSTGCSSLILSTSKGVITHQEALRLRLGGQLICIIY